MLAATSCGLGSIPGHPLAVAAMAVAAMANRLRFHSRSFFELVAPYASGGASGAVPCSGARRPRSGSAACHLDPGNTTEGVRFRDLLQATLAAFEQRGQALQIRLDAGYGNYATLEALKTAEIGFVLKWKDNRTPRKFATNMALDWQQHTDKVRVAEGPEFASSGS